MATYINCEKLREDRQKENNLIVFNALRTKDSFLVKKHCNSYELDRVLAELNQYGTITLEQLLYKCSVDFIYAMALAGRISKVASRQGTQDERYILKKCNETLSPVGIKVENLTTTAFRPTKDGRILTNKEYKKSGLKKNDCLKSFDAHLSGLVNGWVFAKVAYGTGGHQDNVFSEAHEFGEWVKKYRKPNELYVILIDTDLTSQVEELRQKFKEQVLVCNHFEFQHWLLNRAMQYIL